VLGKAFLHATILMQFFFTGNTTSGSSEIALWIIAIGILVSTVLSVLAFMGLAQGLQVRFLKSQIEVRLRVLEGYARDASREASEYLKRLGSENSDEIVSIINEYFTIEPVSIEPIDIIKRLERLIRSKEERLENIVYKSIPSSVPLYKKQIALTLLILSNALYTAYKIVRHILLLGVKSRSPFIIAQLWMLLPLIMRTAKAYHDAIPAVKEGRPIGDSAGPLAAYRLMRKLPMVQRPEVIAKETLYSIHEYKGRRVVIVKAEGPGSTVGRPGEAVEALAKTFSETLEAIITIDAASKLEGEETGQIAEGVGVAMGDPGPEKIRIERVATKHGIPLYAIVIKMSIEESISGMKREILQGVDKAVERVLKIITEAVSEGKTVIVVGVGNTIGVAQ